jgi:hypothetical protein
MKAFFCLAVCAVFLGSAAGDELEDAVKFHAPFENSCNAVVSEGDEKGSPSEKAVFVDGVYGKGIRSGKGGAAIRFMRENNLDFDNPGTVNVWFKIDCGHGTQGPAIPFWGIGADPQKGILTVGVLNDPMKLCPCRRQIGFLFISRKRPKYARAFAVGTGARRICSGWHLLSAAWSGNKLFVSLDGVPYRSFELEKPLSNEELGYQKRFGVGWSYERWPFALDEFTVYGKKLSDAEIRKIYENGMKNIGGGEQKR